jgi:hypothetical protein
MFYTAPYKNHVPLRNSVTKDDRSLALSVFGGKINHKLIGSKAHRSGSCGIRYRNPKTLIKKSGDMSQKFTLRCEEARNRPKSGLIGTLQHATAMDRYPGSDYY